MSEKAQSEGENIVAELNGETIEGHWKSMERLANAISTEAEAHKSGFEKAKEMRSGAHIRLTCDNCDVKHEAEHARNLAETPQEHADYPDFDCTVEDVNVEAFCPQHGTIPLGYDGCDTCASNSAVMNR